MCSAQQKKTETMSFTKSTFIIIYKETGHIKSSSNIAVLATTAAAACSHLVQDTRSSGEMHTHTRAHNLGIQHNALKHGF